MALSDYKFVLVSGQNVKTFNTTTHRWDIINQLSELTSDIITNNGFAYTDLTTSYSTLQLPYTLSQTLDDGTSVYETEEITKSMGVTSFDETTIDGTDYLICNVPSFIAKDSIVSGDLLYAYSSTENVSPEIINVTLSSAVASHTDATLVSIETAYNYNQQLQFRIKVNNNEYSDWSEAYNSYNIAIGSVPVSSLEMGSNSITVQVKPATDTEGTHIVEKTLTDCLTLSNNMPNIVIITENSNSFKLEATITDPDSDQMAYRLLLTNNNYTNEVIKDWTDLSVGPINITYYIDTTKISVGKINTIKIECKDSASGSTTASASYSFEGKYQNIVFVDKDGEYLTTDKGVILKILDFGQVMAGLDSDVSKVTLKNNNAVDITNLQLSKEYLAPVNNVTVQLSKSDNPFIPLESLDYGDEIIPSGGSKDFYVRISTQLDTEGTCLFDVNAQADSVL